MIILTYHNIKKTSNIVSLSISNVLLVFNTCMMREKREKYIYDYISVRTINQVFLVVASLLTMYMCVCMMGIRMYMCESFFDR